MTKPALKFLTAKILIGLYFVLSLGCQSTKENSTDLQIFRYNEHKNISSLDPAFAKDNANIWAVNQLFNGLVQTDENMQIVPSIASSWNISNNGTQYVFKLRSDVYFHPHERFGLNKTRAVTAHDFVYSFNRLLDPKVASPGRWVLDYVKSFKALNDSILQIDLKRAFPGFLGVLSMKYCSVVALEIVENYNHPFRTHPIGTGPFVFKAWAENDKLVFRKNNNYFEVDNQNQKLPYLDAVAITFLPEKQSEYLQFIQGKLDFISGLDSSYKDDILDANGLLNTKYEGQLRMIKGPYLNTEYLGFYLDSELNEVQNVNLRKAFNYGFDRKKMIDYLRNGIGIPGHGGFIPVGLKGHNNSVGYSYNPKKAKLYLDLFKKDSGQSTPTITISTTENYLDFCEFIQRSLADIGLTIKIDVMPASALKSAKANGKTDVFRASWVADYPDAQNYLSLFYSPNFAPNGPNYTHFYNQKFDSLYNDALSTTNDSIRFEMYQNLDRLVTENAPIVILFYDEVIRFTQNNIKGLGINPTNVLDLKRVRKN